MNPTYTVMMLITAKLKPRIIHIHRQKTSWGILLVYMDIQVSVNSNRTKAVARSEHLATRGVVCTKCSQSIL